ncbi:predicted protein [Pyrenophora tritici-repentis Pt-1C-BFP]|uniref:Uncharacterized protein n=1 Tax=Pyrenophora tritici-repentis (strain Pt-1C-BFP) TaxID=426418 RepID=B2W4K1_PYRTR|nr:uncharacterized protein PTRG_04551 [Pyrenophora tritici-repentis Pt-1C-BFP]EDU47458.1 predicted protein [Pyrenophora tritici-repentis Pt-1C-BFP]
MDVGGDPWSDPHQRPMSRFRSIGIWKLPLWHPSHPPEFQIHGSESLVRSGGEAPWGILYATWMERYGKARTLDVHQVTRDMFEEPQSFQHDVGKEARRSQAMHRRQLQSLLVGEITCAGRSAVRHCAFGVEVLVVLFGTRSRGRDSRSGFTVEKSLPLRRSAPAHYPGAISRIVAEFELSDAIRVTQRSCHSALGRMNRYKHGLL